MTYSRHYRNRRRNPDIDAAYTALVAKAIKGWQKKLGLTQVKQQTKGTGANSANRQLWIKSVGYHSYVSLWLSGKKSWKPGAGSWSLSSIGNAPPSEAKHPTLTGELSGNIGTDSAAILNGIASFVDPSVTFSKVGDGTGGGVKASFSHDPLSLAKTYGPGTKAAPKSKKEEYVAIFDGLQYGGTVFAHLKGVMGGNTGGLTEFKVGKKSHSKKYNVYSITLLPMDGSKPSQMYKYTLRKRKYAGEEPYVSAAVGDMGISIEALQAGSPPAKKGKKAPVKVWWTETMLFGHLAVHDYITVSDLVHADPNESKASSSAHKAALAKLVKAGKLKVVKLSNGTNGYAKAKAPASTKPPKMVYTSMPNQTDVVVYLSQQPGFVKPAQVANALGHTEEAVQKTLDLLTQNGAIQWEIIGGKYGLSASMKKKFQAAAASDKVTAPAKPVSKAASAPVNAPPTQSSGVLAMSYTLRLYKEEGVELKPAGSLGPYKTHRAASIDALTFLLQAGVKRSDIETKGNKNKPTGYEGPGKGGTLIVKIAASKKKIPAFQNPRRNNKALWSRNKWRIEWYDPAAKWRGFAVMGENHSDRPTIYSLNKVGYDRPEVIPKYVKDAVKKLAAEYAGVVIRENPRRNRRW
jgi:hypothetical protein